MPGMRRSEEDERAIPDPELFRRCSEGESRAQELLYKRYFSFAMSVCMRYSRDKYEAMEIINDSYMKVLRSIREFDSSKSFRSWYGRILINSAVDNYRRNMKHLSHQQISSEMEANEEQEPTITAELSANEILSLFNRLPDIKSFLAGRLWLGTAGRIGAVPSGTFRSSSLGRFSAQFTPHRGKIFHIGVGKEEGRGELIEEELHGAQVQIGQAMVHLQCLLPLVLGEQA